jgi:hypothetical protein
MILGNNFGEFVIKCDVCRNVTTKETFPAFLTAVNWKKDKSHGWRSRKTEDGKWQDVCPECAELLPKYQPKPKS